VIASAYPKISVLNLVNSFAEAFPASPSPALVVSREFMALSSVDGAVTREELFLFMMSMRFFLEMSMSTFRSRNLFSMTVSYSLS